MSRFWASWWSGNYEDEGCTVPPFKFWVTGQKGRPDDGLTKAQLKEAESFKSEAAYEQFINKHAKDDCSICAIVEAEDEDGVWKLVAKHFPDYEQRFCDPKADDYVLSDRFL